MFSAGQEIFCFHRTQKLIIMFKNACHWTYLKVDEHGLHPLTSLLRDAH